MKNKFLKIFSLGLLLSLLLANNCLAAKLNNPYDLGVALNEEGEEIIGEASVLLAWSWEGDYSDIKQFKLLWRRAGSGEEWTARYPSAEEEEGPDFTYHLKNLSSGTEYEWRLKAEAQNPDDDSLYEDGSNFQTEEPTFEEEDPDGDNGGGGGGDGDNGGGDGDGTIKQIFGDIENLDEAADAFMNFLITVGFAVGPILIIFSGYLLLTKQDSPESVSKAKKIILFTVLALSIMLFAKGIPSIVKDLFK